MTIEYHSFVEVQNNESHQLYLFKSIIGIFRYFGLNGLLIFKPFTNSELWILSTVFYDEISFQYSKMIDSPLSLFKE